MCCVRARCRRAAGPAYLWPNTLLVSGVALPQSFAGQYFSECYGVWAPVPRGVLAKPDRNTAALSGARRARLAWGVGALSAAIFSLENDGDRSAHPWPQHSRNIVYARYRRTPRRYLIRPSKKLCAGIVQFL